MIRWAAFYDVESAGQSGVRFVLKWGSCGDYVVVSRLGWTVLTDHQRA